MATDKERKEEKPSWFEEIILIGIIMLVCWWLFGWDWIVLLVLALCASLYYFFLRPLILPAIHTFFRK